MTGDRPSRPDPARVRAACRGFVAIAAFVPLSTLGLQGPGPKIALAALGYALLLTGLRTASHAGVLSARAVGLVYILAWLCALSMLAANLPAWLASPPWVWVTSAAVYLMLIVGLGLLIRGLSPVCADCGLPELAVKWQRCGFMWLFVYGAGNAVLQAIVLRQLLWHGNASNIQLPEGSGPIFLLLLAGIVYPSLSLSGVALKTGKAIRIREDRCPNCGYSRQGLPRDICPECGASAGRRPDPAGEAPAQTPEGMHRLAVVPIAATVVLAGLCYWLNPATCKPAWRPTWMVIRDGRTAMALDHMDPLEKPTFIGFIVDSGPLLPKQFTHSARAAQDELMRRLKGGTLSSQEESEVASSALLIQADRETTMGLWGDLFAECVIRKSATADQVDRFVTHSMDLTLVPRSPVRQGDQIPFEIRRVWHGVTQAYRKTLPSEDALSQSVGLTLDSISLDGRDAGSVPPPGSFIPSVDRGEMGEHLYSDAIRDWKPPIAAATPGSHTLAVTLSLGIKPGWAGLLPVLPANVSGFQTPVPMALAAPVRITPPDLPPADVLREGPTPDELAAGIDARVTIIRVESFLSLYPQSGQWLNLKSELAFDVFVRAAGSEHYIGAVSIGDWSAYHHLPISSDTLAAIEASSDADLRVILRPSVSAAARTLRATKVLSGGDVVLIPEVSRR